MRLDKYISKSLGYSRKDVKRLLRSSLISVNDLIVKKADYKVSDNDIVKFQGDEVYYEELVYIMLNKPAGYLSALRDNESPVVMELIDDLNPDLKIVGRLDKDTEGLLLITSDTKLLHNLMHPKKHVRKCYEVAIENELTSDDIELLTNGSIVLDDKVIKPAELKMINPNLVELTISEGRYHQVKRMFQAVKNNVIHLKRTKMGNLALDSELSLGEYRYLTDEEILMLKDNN